MHKKDFVPPSTDDLMDGDAYEIPAIKPNRRALEIDTPQTQVPDSDETDLTGFDPNMTTFECFSLVAKIAVPPIMGNMIQLLV